MAAPNGHVYVEIMAPDLRFAMALLVAAFLFFARRRIVASGRGVWVLLAFVAAAFVPWLATSGNGRYFVSMLLLIGPVCMGLVWLLPISRGARGAAALVILALQAFVVFESPPWRSWNHALWKNGPYFQVDIPRDIADTPATFVTITTISYSLLTPQFHPASHWVNLTALSPDATRSSESARAQRYFARPPVYVFVPTVPSHTLPGGLPDDEIEAVIDRHLAPHRLKIDRAHSCRMLRSRTVADMVLTHPELASAERLNQLGFWLCRLAYPQPYTPDVDQPVAPRVEAAFEKIEQACPRFFPPKVAVTSLIPEGAMRDYAQADMKLYVMNDGRIYYKYWRALNSERVGTVDEVLAPSFHMDCSDIRGRSGLPWDRKL